jgi:hypothetical protein
MTVIRHDFDADGRSTVRRFRTLLKLNALHEANVRNNPLPYLERASERIYQLERILFEAVATATSPAAAPVSCEMISVNKAEYQRFLACLAVLESGLAKLVAGDEDS